MNIKETAYQIASVNMKNKCSPAELEDFAEALVDELAKRNKLVKPRFECWSTNEGDSLYEHPEDAGLIYDVIGDSAKVGDEFEVMAGWCSVQARYHIVSKKDDDFEVECISHDFDNVPAPHTAEQIEQETAEACAKLCRAKAEDARKPRAHLSQMGIECYRGAAISTDECASEIESGAWKEYK